MPKQRVSAWEARNRAIRGQIANMSQRLYGENITGKTFGRMFGVKVRTAQNRIKQLETIQLGELWNYVRVGNPSNEEILAWFGR